VKRTATVSTHHLVDREVLPILEIFPAMELNGETLAAIRATPPPAAPGVAPGDPPEVINVPGPPGAPDIALRVFVPKGEARRRPAIYHIHGGGYVLGTAAMMDAANSARAAEQDAVVVAVDYRLAPETAFPGPLEDCYAGLGWIAAQAPRFGIDPDRIVVLGESAGGGLAAALTLLARDRGGPRIAGQFLIYPMLDHRTGSEDEVTSNPLTGEFIWTREHNQFGWRALRGAEPIGPQRMGYFSPALATDLSGLPPCFLVTGSLDLFLEEDVDYALRLIRSGVPTEFHSYAGAIHAFDMVMEAAVSRRFAADLGSAIKRGLDDRRRS
jgi:acetyl esterase